MVDKDFVTFSKIHGLKFEEIDEDPLFGGTNNFLIIPLGILLSYICIIGKCKYYVIYFRSF